VGLEAISQVTMPGVMVVEIYSYEGLNCTGEKFFISKDLRKS
jgi:hypothetical protein